MQRAQGRQEYLKSEEKPVKLGRELGRMACKGSAEPGSLGLGCCKESWDLEEQDIRRFCGSI